PADPRRAGPAARRADPVRHRRGRDDLLRRALGRGQCRHRGPPDGVRPEPDHRRAPGRPGHRPGARIPDHPQPVPLAAASGRRAGRARGADRRDRPAARRRLHRRSFPGPPGARPARCGRAAGAHHPTGEGDPMTTEYRHATTVLVIGSGGAGLRAAIELAERHVDVIVVGKRPRSDAHTTLAAGGINASLGTMDPADSWQQHAADTIKESYCLADPRTVEIVTRGAEQGIRDLERFGTEFAREADGRISQRFFGAHKYRRTAFAGDYTGLAIQRALVARAEQLGVTILDGVYVTRIPVDDGTVFGAYGFDLADGSRRLFHADAVILAAGGHTRIWRRT